MPFTTKLPAALGRARRRRGGAPARPRGHEPLPAPAPLHGSGAERTTSTSRSGLRRASTASGAAPTAARRGSWLLFAVAVSSVWAAVVWRSAAGRSRGAWRDPALPASPALPRLSVVALGRGPLLFKPKPWNAASFRETLTGHVAQLNGVSRGIVSMAGEGHGHQRVLIRADLLVSTASS